MFKKFSLLALLALSFLAASANSATLKDYGLEKYQGQVVYVDFWASWCGPCRQSFPWMNDMYSKYKNQGFIVVGINVDEEKKNAEKFLEAHPASFPVMYDPKGKLAEAFQVPGMPTSYLFDTSGKLVHTTKGFKNSKSKEYEDHIKKLILGR